VHVGSLRPQRLGLWESGFECESECSRFARGV